ncbi:MAG: DUF763 domain-containing protein [Candidatus Methanomethylicota archaeon]|uniref:DUF763 domain-containing protein n=1 Tax=Thermoproteota archaeon TaxID=2056631 RepID=A0A520KEJ1_9CREN|nr:MAG: DUF763 domain-containing protein [Candidatus Verstraetearchaeota archaeon]TDA38226.1 MAG: DUF763 domain-containing protein [Candidatus Verstraetearchaeota archaeon]
MYYTGSAYLPLHSGHAPNWLIKRMKALAQSITTIIINEYGRKEFLRRISNPYWFQAFGCVLGFDWHSSGLTTVVTGVLKSSINYEETGIAICGGKGIKSRATPEEITTIGEKLGLSTSRISKLIYASKICAKVDNTAIQAGYQLYHHVFILSEDGEWAIVQQGMNPKNKLARRYHWLSENINSFVVEPHKGIIGYKEDKVLNMIAKESEGCRKVSVDIVKEKSLGKYIVEVKSGQKSILEYTNSNILVMPWHINWKALEKAYNIQPKNYEELLAIEGIGPATIRGLALVSDIIYGEPPSWKDPVKYSFAFGGKDGVPFPILRKEMDEAIEFLKIAIEQAKINEKERLNALKRLKCIFDNNKKL